MKNGRDLSFRHQIHFPLLQQQKNKLFLLYLIQQRKRKVSTSGEKRNKLFHSSGMYAHYFKQRDLRHEIFNGFVKQKAHCLATNQIIKMRPRNELISHELYNRIDVILAVYFSASHFNKISVY